MIDRVPKTASLDERNTTRATSRSTRPPTEASSDGRFGLRARPPPCTTATGGRRRRSFRKERPRTKRSAADKPERRWRLYGDCMARRPATVDPPSGSLPKKSYGAGEHAGRNC